MMASMTVRSASGCINRMSLPENLRLGVAATSVDFFGTRNRGRGLSARASKSNFQDVNMVNGKKVNGIYHVDGVDHHDPFAPNEESQWQGEVPIHTCLLGRFVEDRFVYRQTFVIRSYEIGPDQTATMETLMNLLQETALNHVRGSGLAGNGFGATHEMSLRKLIWVVTRVHVHVERYSSWGDVVEIDTWVDAAGKNGMRRDWIIRDCISQKVITRATSTWVIMNRETRRLSKIPEQVRREVTPFYLNRVAIAPQDMDDAKIDKLTDERAERIRSGLAPRWNDMDSNQHVNNVKYIGWILESVPIDVLEKYNLASMTLEYRRECRQSNLLESLTNLTAIDSRTGDEVIDKAKVGAKISSTHLLRMQTDNAEIVRARSEWQSKPGLEV